MLASISDFLSFTGLNFPNLSAAGETWVGLAADLNWKREDKLVNTVLAVSQDTSVMSKDIVFPHLVAASRIQYKALKLFAIIEIK